MGNGIAGGSRTFRRLGALAGCALAILGAASPARAADGDLDPSFSDDGLLYLLSPAGNSVQTSDLVLQPDGKIVVGSWLTGFDSTRYLALSRYQADGELDPSFGTAGWALVPFPGSGVNLTALALQPDGKIVAAGSLIRGSYFYFLLVRLLPGGILDTTFGRSGVVVTAHPGALRDQAFAVALQPDGKILAGGSYTSEMPGANSAFLLARYLPGGFLDPEFGDGGLVVIDPAPEIDERVVDLAIQPDGRIVAAGESELGVDHDFALLRLLPDGSPDPSFGTGGLVLTDFGTNRFDDAAAVALAPGGAIVVGGKTQRGASDPDFALARYGPDGQLDPGFGDGGLVITDLGRMGSDLGRAVALHPDGRITVAGSSANYLALARYLGQGGVTAIPALGPAGPAVLAALLALASLAVLRHRGSLG